MSIPVNIDLNDHKRGDFWSGISQIGPVLIDGEQPDDELNRLRMHFVKGSSTYKLDSDSTQSPDAPITINDSVTWDATISKVQDFLPTCGNWKWDMEFYSGTNTSPQTFYSGVLTVVDDVTK
mgnify:CR=1 FL=1